MRSHTHNALEFYQRYPKPYMIGFKISMSKSIADLRRNQKDNYVGDVMAKDRQTGIERIEPSQNIVAYPHMKPFISFILLY